MNYLGFVVLGLTLSNAAFADREIVCQNPSQNINGIQALKLHLDLPNTNTAGLPGLAVFKRDTQTEWSAPIYAGEEFSRGNDESVFGWQESVLGTNGDVAEAYDLRLVKKNASQKSRASWVLRLVKTEKIGGETCDVFHDPDCRVVSITVSESSILCTDTNDTFRATPESDTCRYPGHCDENR